MGRDYLKSFGKLVLVTAIAIGCVNKFCPHLFFKIPMGFILWAIGGNPMPPYIQPGPFDEGNTDWLKDNDVVVTPAAKSGTTWMLYCSHMIRVKGDDVKFPFVDVSLTTPWPELIQTPGDTWEEQKEKFNSTVLADGTSFKEYWDNPEYPFRIFKSHDHAEQFGNLIGSKNPSKKVKFLAMARPALDQIASMVPFFESHSDEFRKVWGGFPPATGGSTSELAKERYAQAQPPDGIWWTMTLPYVKSWWKVKDEDNVLLLHYADAVKDLKGTVKKMSDFYGVKLNSKQFDKVVDRCGYKHMKNMEHLFEYTMPLNKKFEGRIMKSGTMIRKGKNGDGKVVFTEEEKADWAKVEEEFFGNMTDALEWHRHGSL